MEHRPTVMRAHSSILLYERAVRDAITPACLFVSVYYAMLAWVHWASLPAGQRWVLVALSVLTSVVFAALAIHWWRHRPAGVVVITWILTAISVNNCIAISVFGIESAFYGQVISQAGLGFVGLTWSRFFLQSAVIFGAYFIGAAIQGMGPVWVENGLILSATGLFSILMQLLSLRYREQLAAAHRESELQRLAAEDNLVRFQSESQQREQLQERLAHAERLQSLGLLAGGVAHDFNNLLSIIVGRASLLQRRIHSSPERLEVDAILDAGERAALLSRELLAYAGRGTTIVAPLDLGREVAGVCALARSSLPASVELRVEPPAVPLVVRADRGQIQQIILNLLLNARDAIPTQGGAIEVSFDSRQLDAAAAGALEPPMVRQAGAYCVVRVKDEGIGMSAETLKHVFDPFYSTKDDGRGLGLAAALGIARAHGGGFQVESTVAAGSVFTLFLPASDGLPATINPAEPRRSPGVRPTILVVDDQEDIRRMLVRMLQNAEYPALDVSGGAAAIALLQAAPDAVQAAIVDMSMPDMDGEATFHALRALRPNLPILLSSGFDFHEAAARLAQQPRVAFLAKPYRLGQLTGALDTLVGAEVDTQPG